MRFLLFMLLGWALLPSHLAAQHIHLQKRAVYADGEKVLAYQRGEWGTALHFRGLKSGRDIFYMRSLLGQKEYELIPEEQIQIEFVGKGLQMKTTRRLSQEAWITMMAQMNVFDEDWEVVEENAQAFIERFGEE